MDIDELLKNLKEITPKNGLIFSQKSPLAEVLCKPKILPLKSITLQKLEEMERNLQMEAKMANQMK